MVSVKEPLCNSIDFVVTNPIKTDVKWSPTRADMLVALAVVLAGLVFATYTQHAWEDYWITFRISRNCATGHGLVYTPGERLQVFTSPLGVLLPAGLSWMTGNQSDELVLWLFRFLSIAALAAGVVLLFHMLRSLQKNRISTFLTLALVGLDAKTLDFSVNGMETGLLVFFLALTIHGFLLAGPSQVLRIGIGWAGLMWTRPDSFVYIAILGLGALLFLPLQPTGKARSEWGKILLTACLVCTVLYLPWFGWTWNYYGSPVSNTIVAKATNTTVPAFGNLLVDFLLFPAKLLAGDTSLIWTFLPAYAWYGGWHYSLCAAAGALGLTAALVWLIPLLHPQTRLLSLAFFLGNFFVTDVIRSYFPWYLPPAAVFGYLTLGLLFDQFLIFAAQLPRLGWARGWFRHLPKVLRVTAVMLAVGQAAVTVCVARQMQAQQQLIENGIRRSIGLWLRNHAQSQHDTVMTESLGYIGYFSGLKMFDFPGLSSKEMVETRKRLGPDKENQAFLELKPDWLILRPTEIKNEKFAQKKPLKEFYDWVRVFDASDKINAIRWLPGRNYLWLDQTFLVFHRKPVASPKPDN
jgi:hypothetical protein